MKYIIKNCPSYKTFYPDTGTEPFTACDAELPFKRCQDCTDCLLKQIVEKCLTKYYDDDFGHGKFVMANQILRTFDIQEIKE